MTGHATGHQPSITGSIIETEQTTMTAAAVSDHVSVPVKRDDSRDKLTAADRLGITDDYLLRKADEVLSDAMHGDATYDRDGNFVANVPNLNAANRALELLMKHRGMLAADTEHEIAIGLNVTINGIDPEQLR